MTAPRCATCRSSRTISLPNYADIQRLTTGASVAVHGKLIASQGKGQSWEVVANEIEIIGASDDSYPLQKKGHTPEFLREIAHLRPRSNLFGSVFRVRSRLGFRHPPILPGSRLLLSQHADHYRQRLRRRRRIVSRHGNRSEKPAEETRMALSITRKISSRAKLISRSADNSKPKRSPARSRKFIPSVRPSARRTRTLRDTRTNSG